MDKFGWKGGFLLKKMMVYCPNHCYPGQSIAGVYLDLDDHPIQAYHRAGKDACQHELSVGEKRVIVKSG